MFHNMSVTFGGLDVSASERPVSLSGGSRLPADLFPSNSRPLFYTIGRERPKVKRESFVLVGKLMALLFSGAVSSPPDIRELRFPCLISLPPPFLSAVILLKS